MKFKGHAAPFQLLSEFKGHDDYIDQCIVVVDDGKGGILRIVNTFDIDYHLDTPLTPANCTAHAKLFKESKNLLEFAQTVHSQLRDKSELNLFEEGLFIGAEKLLKNIL